MVLGIFGAVWLVSLVLTLVEPLRQLMERRARGLNIDLGALGTLLSHQG